MKDNYIIGTRGSLLALTQCNLIKSEIEKKSQLKFELKVIKTQGDQITDKPLWQLEGKDFFTKELDSSLLEKKIDLVVHSYKDLGSERPENITLRTITKREYAHDILLIKKETIQNLNAMDSLVVGTSSPRRIHNITKSLAKNLPNPKVKVHCETLRGNVNGRIEKLLNRKYDAIVLALAGLERLANKDDSKEILKGLVKDLSFMVLPQRDFPSSASQGALAIESHTDASDELISALRNVHDLDTAEEIQRERKAFNSYGGGCHLAVGVHVKKLHDMFIHIHQGTTDNKEIHKIYLEGEDYTSLKNKSIYHVLGENDFLISKSPLTTKSSQKSNLFVTSKHCINNISNFNSLWSAGASTRTALLKKGFWINGCADGFGHNEIAKLKESKALKLILKNEDWQTLSHDNATSEVGTLTPCYTHEVLKNFDEQKAENILKSEAIYWNSFSQYKIYTATFPELKQKTHICGLGKTLDQFKAKELPIIPTISYNYLIQRLENE